MKANHMLICAAIAAVVLVLVASGASAAFLLLPLACMAMMGAMMWLMMRPGDKDRQ
jgi:hypothetical protein